MSKTGRSGCHFVSGVVWTVGSAQNFESGKRQGNETIRLDGHAGLIKLRGQLERDVEGLRI
jgi:hypothetical protein